MCGVGRKGNKMSKMAKGTVRLQLTEAEVKVTLKALKSTERAGVFQPKESAAAKKVVEKLIK